VGENFYDQATGDTDRFALPSRKENTLSTPGLPSDSMSTLPVDVSQMKQPITVVSRIGQLNEQKAWVPEGNKNHGQDIKSHLS
jgi:hypothetical protein